MMISCKKAADLLCQSLDRPLLRWERWQLRAHLWICQPCTDFERQNKAMLDLIEHHFRGVSEKSAIDSDDLDAQSREACERIKQRLRDVRVHGTSASNRDRSDRTEQ